MALLPTSFLHSSLARLLPAALLARWTRDDKSVPAHLTRDALIYDPKTGRYKLKKEIFDQLLSDAAQSIWLDKKSQV
jgi:hypothetical protein